MQTICVIQAHTNSTRFPGKIYEDLGGQSVLQRCVNACRQVWDTVFVAGPENDNRLQDYCGENDLPLLQPAVQESDVLSRYVAASKMFPGCRVARITSDCPVLNVPLMLHMNSIDDDVTNVIPPTWPDGWDCQILTEGTLHRMDRLVKGSHREHVASTHENYKPYVVRSPVDLSHIKLSVDTPEDLENIRRMLWKQS